MRSPTQTSPRECSRAPIRQSKSLDHTVACPSPKKGAFQPNNIGSHYSFQDPNKTVQQWNAVAFGSPENTGQPVITSADWYMNKCGVFCKETEHSTRAFSIVCLQACQGRRDILKGMKGIYDHYNR